MGEALEALAEMGKDQPVFSRGAEIEITTREDLELIRSHLAQMKIHVNYKTLENAIVMPRDLD